MKNTPFLSIVTESFDRMFVNDKHGKTIFFPWGSKKQGYYIKNKSAISKAKKFYKSSFLVCFIILMIALSIFDKNFWAIIGSMFVCFGGWYFACFLYASRIIKSLSPVKASYKEIILEKIESEGEKEEEITQSETQFPAQWSKPIPQTQEVPFAGIKRIWYRLSPGQLFTIFVLLGFIVPLIWISYHPQKPNEQSENSLAIFFVFFFWGLSGFVMTKSIESSKKDLAGFIRWKLPWIFVMIFFWALAIYSLYQFVVMAV